MTQSTVLWYGSWEHHNTALYQDPQADNGDPLGGLSIGQILQFISFTYNDVQHPCV
jgi:hypothetical protein